jgi:perosamine synthetase
MTTEHATATRPIPLSRPFLDEREEQQVVEVLRSGRLSLGPWIERFEELFAEQVGAPYAAAVSSGTAGLHLLCHAAGLESGDEAITSPYSFVASANCAIYEGATPVFADVDPRTFNLDPAAVEAAISPRTRAIVAVDIFGYPCELDPLRELCERHGLALVQDACEALGAAYRGRPVGSHGPSAVFALYPNKQITTGEGGVVTTHSEAEWRLLKSLSNQGRADDGGWLEHARLGFNYRIDDIRAAIGIAQLEKLDEILERRRAVAARYTSMLENVQGVTPPLGDDDEHVRSWFVYVVELEEGVDRERVIGVLERNGVGTARYLPAVHLQPYMRERYGFSEGLCPVAESLARRTLALPFHTAIEPGDQERVVEVLAGALA